jgi:hypothetical protein
MSLLNTTWEFSDNGKPTVITIDRTGAYIENRADGTHVDHGTYVQKDGKDCFTSAMGDKGTSCWTAVPEVEVELPRRRRRTAGKAPSSSGSTTER